MKTLTAARALGALAQETRLRIFRLLVEAGGAGIPAGRIAGRLALPAPTLSFHLAQLKRARLARCRREGRSLVYSADYASMQGLLDYLTENCCAGSCDADARPAARRAASRG